MTPHSKEKRLRHQYKDVFTCLLTTIDLLKTLRPKVREGREDRLRMNVNAYLIFVTGATGGAGVNFFQPA